MKITQIKQQKKLDRVNVYLDGEFGFGIDLENFVTLGLRVEQVLTQEEVEKIIRKASFQKTFDKLLHFAMIRPRSEKEVKDWFRRKEVDETIHEELIQKLKNFELLNDAKFAEWWINQRQEFRPKPKRILNYELRMKGVKKDIIDDALESTEVDETKIAKALISKNLYKWKRFDAAAAHKKKMEYLARKGFGWDVIKEAVKSQIDDSD